MTRSWARVARIVCDPCGNREIAYLERDEHGNVRLQRGVFQPPTSGNRQFPIVGMPKVPVPGSSVRVWCEEGGHGQLRATVADLVDAGSRGSPHKLATIRAEHSASV